MSPPAGPFARCAPALVAGQPVHRPGQRGLRDNIAQLPFPFVWIVQAQDRILRIGNVRIMMRDRFVGVFQAVRKNRVKDCDLWHSRQYLDRIEIAPKTIKHPDKIALMDGAQPPPPK